MGIRTVEEYKESLRDGRKVYISGERVEDITKHRVLGLTVDTIGAAYELAQTADQETKDLLIAKHPETGEPINRFYVTPKTPDQKKLRSVRIRDTGIRSLQSTEMATPNP